MRRFFLPVTLVVSSTIALVAATLGYVPVLQSDIALQTLRVLLWVSSIALCARVLAVLLRANFIRRSGHAPPSLLIDVFTASVWIASLSMMAVVELGISPSAAFATSGVLIAVIGFAVRSLVADLFYGITMAIERPFEIGNWIGLNDGIIGRVEEMTWRAVKIVTKDNIRVVVPNTQLAVEHIVNYDQPQPYWRNSLKVTLGHDVNAEQVKNILLAAVQQVPASAAVEQEPEARIVGFNEQGVEWELRYWLPDYPSFSEVNQSIQEAFLQHLRFAGLQIPRPKEEVFVTDLSQQLELENAKGRHWIDQVDLFSVVSHQDRLQLQQQARLHRFEAGDDIVRQGEPGSSLFIVQEGTLRVYIENDLGNSEAVGTMGPGAVLGELSLLTGAPRSATVRAATHVVAHEITKQDLEPLLIAEPELAQSFAEIVADRRLADSHRDAQSAEELDTARANLVDSLLSRARHFFKLGRGPRDRDHALTKS